VLPCTGDVDFERIVNTLSLFNPIWCTGTVLLNAKILLRTDLPPEYEDARDFHSWM